MTRHDNRLILLAAMLVFAGCTARQGGIDAPGEGGASLAARTESIVEQRAAFHASQTSLVVDYYRIYRKLAFPLPVTAIDHPPMAVEGRSSYPWEIWMIWALEERIGCLGWAGHWLEHQAFRSLAQQDLEALAEWPAYNVEKEPHLSIGHAARIMAGAYRDWPWLSPQVRRKIEQACARLVDNHAQWLETTRLEFTSAEQILGSPKLGSLTHNIPVIATLGMSMAARICGHRLEQALERHCLALILTELALRTKDVTEAVSYDGYVLDFVSDWLRGAGPESRRAVLEHPMLGEMLNQSVLLAVPGDILQFAPFNDVEPVEMPFHASAHAKLTHFRQGPRSAWFLERFPLTAQRADALAALHALDDLHGPMVTQAPVAGAVEGLYALILRTGWEKDDLAVAISASNSPVGHIQKDNGSLVIGTGGHWLIDDPGYQQYLAGLEREFTLGPNAHNDPHVDGRTQQACAVKRLACGDMGDGVLYAAVDITGGYDPTLGLERVIREVWQVGKDLVVVADRIDGPSDRTVRYCWHAHPKAALWVERGACLIRLDNTGLWVQCTERKLDGSELVRLPGTRGQMSILTELATGRQSCTWWVFNLGETPAEYEIGENSQSIKVGNREFRVAGEQVGEPD